MGDLPKLTYLIATDPGFREKLLENPEATVASADFKLSAEELAAISELRHLIALPAGVLVTTVLAFNPDFKWG